MNKIILGVIITLSLILITIQGAVAVSIEEAKITASDGATGDWFGISISIDGDRVIVGARFDDNKGSAYVYDFDGTSWVETEKITASDGATGDDFGEAVAIDGDRVIVGARFENENGSFSGSAYVYDFDGTSWVETEKITASDGMLLDLFGEAVAIDGDRVIVGATGDDSNSGSAYVYDFDGTSWVETEKITASDGAVNKQFGASVAIDGDRVIVGAFGDNENGSRSGSAYVYDFDGTSWVETEKITASDGAADEEFGVSVAIDGDRVIVGARINPLSSSPGSGSAYVYDFNGTSWVETEKITASDGAGGDSFGTSVAIGGNLAVIGSINNNGNIANSGSAYIYEFDGVEWVETKITASDGAGGDSFGTSVAIGGNLAVIGSINNNGNIANSGSAYIYNITPSNTGNGNQANNNRGGGCTGDCSPPTLGIDENEKRVVTNGFTYNDTPINVEQFYTPYPLITVDVGKQNTAVFKIYDNSGPYNIRHFEFAFGLGKGEIINESKARIEWNRTFDGVESVTVIDPENVLDDDTLKVTSEVGNCNEFKNFKPKCLIIKIDHTFREPLNFNMVGTNVWDAKRNAWQNYYNDGIEIIGESLNPPNKTKIPNPYYQNKSNDILVELVQIDKKNNIWEDEHNHYWTKNSYDTWIRLTTPDLQRYQDVMSKVMTRNNSNFVALFEYEKEKAITIFDSLKIQNQIPDYFAYTYPDHIPNKLDNPELQNNMIVEESRAKEVLKKMIKEIHAKETLRQMIE